MFLQFLLEYLFLPLLAPMSIKLGLTEGGCSCSHVSPQTKGLLDVTQANRPLSVGSIAPPSNSWGCIIHILHYFYCCCQRSVPYEVLFLRHRSALFRGTSALFPEGTSRCGGESSWTGESAHELPKFYAASREPRSPGCAQGPENLHLNP